MATSSTTTISQLSCFSSLNSRLHHLHRRSILSLPQSPRYKSWVVMSIEGHNNEVHTSTSNIKTSSTNHNYTAPEEYKGISDPVKGVYGSAKIHDFCFGIPFGTGVLFGVALLALSNFSLKIWRQGKSSLPFVLGQAVLAAALCWNNFRAYSWLTKKVIPTGFFAVISAAMLCFYSYVMISGGNPPQRSCSHLLVSIHNKKLRRPGKGGG
ncbi:protein FATTY ACID EXPORT [Salix suchowensis]|nr:protein FATTY ACID EXPORT [Salix suchowensis]